MPGVIATLTRSASKKSTRKKQTTQKAMTKISRQKDLILKLKAPGNNVKRKSYKTLTIQIYFFFKKQQSVRFPYETR